MRPRRSPAIIVLLALVASLSLVFVGAQPASATEPSWWNGACDVNNYPYTPDAYPLGASFNGVEACGPGPTQGGTDHLVHFYQGAWGEYEWECVELVMRYMYLVYGIAPYNAPGGKDVVNNYSGNVLTKVTNNGVSVPSPGDILSFAASANHPTVGHAAVVTNVNVDVNGNGTVTTMEQNASANGAGSVTVTSKTLGDGVSGWLHDPNGTAQGAGPSIAFNPSNGLPTIATRGPNNSLYVYWETSDAQWHGPLGVGVAYSAPSIAFHPTNGLPTVAVKGSNSSLYIYWQTSNGAWNGPVGPGAATSAPSIAFNPSTNLPTVAVQGPSNSLYVYWQTSNGAWNGPLGPGVSYAAPSIAFNASTAKATVATQGPSNSLYIYWQNSSGWNGPLGPGVSYAAPSIAFNPSTNLPTVAVKGSNSSLYAYWLTIGGWNGPVGPGAATSTPSIAFEATTALPTVAVQGPSKSLYIYWQTSDAQWHGPLGVGVSY